MIALREIGFKIVREGIHASASSDVRRHAKGQFRIGHETFGIRNGLKMTVLRFVAVSVITLLRDTSLPVPTLLGQLETVVHWN